MRHRRPVTLTVKQREQKLAFCIVVGAALILLAGWGLVWWIAGLADGAFSILHFAAFVLGGLLGVTLLSIADREGGEQKVLPDGFLLSASGGVKENTCKPQCQ